MPSSSIDPRDLDLLKAIAGGRNYFKPDPAQAATAPRWLQEIERLRRLRSRGLIRMPEPDEFYQQPGIHDAGLCELRADGWDALERNR